MTVAHSGSASARANDNAVVVRGGSVVEYTLGGRRYPYKSSPRCKVCQSPSRMEIEEGILTGRTYAAILRSLPTDLTDGEDGISKTSMANHAKEHMPLDAIVSRAVIEQRVADRGRSLDDPTGTLIDHHIMATEIVRQAGERMLRGELKVGIEHALAAMKMLYDEEARVQADVDESASEAMMLSLFTSLRQILPPDTMRALSTRLRHNPAWTQLFMKQLGMGDPVVVEAGLVDPAKSP